MKVKIVHCFTLTKASNKVSFTQVLLIGKLVALFYSVLSSLSSHLDALWVVIVRKARTRLSPLSHRFDSKVPKTKSAVGDRAFAAAGPRRWNEIPLNA